jgi:hypothetical protein
MRTSCRYFYRWPNKRTGWRDWAEPKNVSKGFDIIDFVADYNQRYIPGFRGIQYDIEPYLLPRYNNNKEEVLTQYIEMIDSLVKKARERQILIRFVIPHFYDDTIQWTPSVNFNGTVDYTYNHLLKLLNNVPDSHIIIMAYRNFTEGEDGAVALAATEIAQANETNVKIIVAQETGPVTPDYVTFAGLSMNDLLNQIAKIEEAFTEDTSYAGTGVNYLDPFLHLDK